MTNNVLMKTLCRCFYSSVIWLRRVAWIRLVCRFDQKEKSDFSSIFKSIKESTTPIRSAMFFCGKIFYFARGTWICFLAISWRLKLICFGKCAPSNGTSRQLQIIKRNALLSSVSAGVCVRNFNAIKDWKLISLKLISPSPWTALDEFPAPESSDERTYFWQINSVTNSKNVI